VFLTRCFAESSRLSLQAKPDALIAQRYLRALLAYTGHFYAVFRLAFAV